MEKHLLREYEDGGCRHMTWECRYRGQRYRVAIQDCIRSVDEPETWVWYINHIACEGWPYHVPLAEGSGEQPPEPEYPDPDAALRAAAGLIDQWLAGPLPRCKMQGVGMQPTIEDREKVPVDRTAYEEASPLPGDLVYLLFPAPPGQRRSATVRRVIGVPGDVVEVRAGVVSVNGEPLREPYVQWPAQYSWGPERVPPGEYFVLGDNRQTSADSHVFGFVPAADILGRVVLPRGDESGGR